MKVPPHERGVALLTVLLLVAVMSTLAVGVLDDIRFSLRRTANAQAVGQARWYAMGAEALARNEIQRLSVLASDRTTLDGGWNGRVIRFPIDDGLIQARVRDATHCLNLNSVVTGTDGTWTRNETGVAQFTALAAGLGLPPNLADGLAAALVDWIDADQARENGGGEDEAYARAAIPYRTAGTLLAEASELRAIRGFEPEVYDRLRPYVCALPTADLSPINVNTLPEEKAVLLTAVTGGDLSVERARRVIAGRPAAGWTSVSEFWRSEGLEGAIPSDAAVNQVQVRTLYFGLDTEVAYLDAEVVSSALFQQGRDGRLRLAARRWARDE